MVSRNNLFSAVFFAVATATAGAPPHWVLNSSAFLEYGSPRGPDGKLDRATIDATLREIRKVFGALDRAASSAIISSASP